MKILLIAGAALAPFAVALAADEVSKPQTLTPVVVTGTRSPEPENRLPAAVTVITREQIERSGAANVVEVLRASGTAQVRDFYGDGSRTQIDLRGFGDTTNANTLILIDGRRLNNPDIASPDLNSIALKDVERIEILKGSASVLYGDQASGGVVNIITRSPEKLNAGIETTVGSYSNLGVRGQASQRINDFAYRVSAEDRGSKNYRDNNGNEYRNFFGLLEYNYGDNSRVFFESDYSDEDVRAPGALTASQMQQNRRQVQPTSTRDFIDSRTKNFRAGIDQNLWGSWSLLAEGTYRGNDADGILSGTSFTQDREVMAATPRFVGTFDVPSGVARTTFGSDWQRARYGLVAFGPTKNDQTQRDFYGQVIIPLPFHLETTLGGRLARIENEGRAFGGPFYFHDTRHSEELGFAWRPVSKLRSYVRYASNFRFAKVDEFTDASLPACQPNQPLCTQTGRSYELGAEWTESKWSASLNAYRTDLNKEITFASPVSLGFGTNLNLPSTRRVGQNAKLTWKALDSLQVSAQYEHLDAFINDGEFAGKNIPLVASQTGSFMADASLPWQLQGHAEIVASGRRPIGADFANVNGELAGYALTNLALSRNIGPWQFAARLNNIFDVRYAEYGARDFTGASTFYPSPEFNWLLTLRYVYGS